MRVGQFVHKLVLTCNTGCLLGVVFPKLLIILTWADGAGWVTVGERLAPSILVWVKGPIFRVVVAGVLISVMLWLVPCRWCQIMTQLGKPALLVTTASKLGSPVALSSFTSMGATVSLAHGLPTKWHGWDPALVTHMTHFVTVPTNDQFCLGPLDCAFNGCY